MAGQDTFCGSRSSKISIIWLPLIVVFVVLGTGGVTSAQTKPERQSKAAKPTQPASPSTTNPSSQSAPAATDSVKPEEKPFKGMKYRMIGPFRGGRSLTAAGIPGDPTTYYFGATGGGVWKSR